MRLRMFLSRGELLIRCGCVFPYLSKRKRRTCANGTYLIATTPGIRFRATLAACKIHGEICQCRSVHVFYVSRRVIVHLVVRKLFDRARKTRGDDEIARYKRSEHGVAGLLDGGGMLLSSASRGMITRFKARVKLVAQMSNHKK